MFLKNLFGHKNTNNSPIKDQWSVLQGSNEDNPMIIRLNTGVKSIVGQAPYVYRIGIAVPLLQPQENKMPSPKENLDFNNIEDEIYNLFEKNNEAYVCAIITTNGMKEYLIYSSTDLNINKNIEILKSKFSKYEFQNYVQKDSNWDVYKSLLNKKF
jgi:hypothetical protein